MNIYYYKHWNHRGISKPLLSYNLLLHNMICIPCYTKFTLSIYICGPIVLWVSAGWMCQLYFIACLELFMCWEVPAQSTELCCFSTVSHPWPCVYWPLTSQSMQLQHRPTSDTSYFKYTITQCAPPPVMTGKAYIRTDSHLVKCFPVYTDKFSSSVSAAVMNGCLVFILKTYTVWWRRTSSMKGHK